MIKKKNHKQKPFLSWQCIKPITSCVLTVSKHLHFLVMTLYQHNHNFLSRQNQNFHYLFSCHYIKTFNISYQNAIYKLSLFLVMTQHHNIHFFLSFPCQNIYYFLSLHCINTFTIFCHDTISNIHHFLSWHDIKTLTLYFHITTSSLFHNINVFLGASVSLRNQFKLE